MKIAMNRLIRGEKGAAMVLAVILLLIGGLIATPLLAHMGTGIIAGEVYERRTAELYAADAGVEDAMWNIQLDTDKVNGLTQCYQSTNYTIPGVNDRSVDVTITLVSNVTFTYRVVSTAITDDGSGTVATVSGTQIEAYITGTIVSGNYSGILDHVICTKEGDLEDIKENVEIIYDEDNEPVAGYEGAWPTADDLTAWYWQDVKDATHYDGDTEIDLKGNSCPGPIYINGEAVDCPSGLGPLYIEDIENIEDGKLDIKNSINDEATLTLDGTLYITGDTEIGNTDHYFTLDLNGHTIFVASNSTGNGNEALIIGGRCTIKGPGVIIAVGDIYFAPNPDVGSEEGPVFVLSVSGTTRIRPGINMCGAIAGSVDVTIQSGSNPTIRYPEEEGWYEGLNFPIGNIQNQQLVYSIYTWEISQL